MIEQMRVLVISSGIKRTELTRPARESCNDLPELGLHLINCTADDDHDWPSSAAGAIRSGMRRARALSAHRRQYRYVAVSPTVRGR